MARSKSFDPNQHLVKALAALDKQIADLQTKRAQLASIVGGGKAPKASSSEKPKRAMSEAARKKISDAQKKRWRDQKKGK